MASAYDFLILQWCQKNTHTIETVLQILIFFQASDVQYDILL